MIYYFGVFSAILLCQSASSSPIGDLSVSISKSVGNPTDNSVYDGEEFADVSSGYKKDEAFKISLFDVDQVEQFDEPVATIETGADIAKLEFEAIPSKVLTLYDKTHAKAADVVKNPIPIVDTIEEKDKYGNAGDKYDGISRAIINGYEAFANFLNALIEKPKSIARSISKGITQKLDLVGAKIVGLA
ncbi:hypothetical protein ACFFRR_001518 [Megaselia abdita]